MYIIDPLIQLSGGCSQLWCSWWNRFIHCFHCFSSSSTGAHTLFRLVDDEEFNFVEGWFDMKSQGFFIFFFFTLKSDASLNCLNIYFVFIKVLLCIPFYSKRYTIQNIPPFVHIFLVRGNDDLSLWSQFPSLSNWGDTSLHQALKISLDDQHLYQTTWLEMVNFVQNRANSDRILSLGDAL